MNFLPDLFFQFFLTWKNGLIFFGKNGIVVFRKCKFNHSFVLFFTENDPDRRIFFCQASLFCHSS